MIFKWYSRYHRDNYTRVQAETKRKMIVVHQSESERKAAAESVLCAKINRMAPSRDWHTLQLAISSVFTTTSIIDNHGSPNNHQKEQAERKGNEDSLSVSSPRPSSYTRIWAAFAVDWITLAKLPSWKSWTEKISWVLARRWDSISRRLFTESKSLHVHLRLRSWAHLRW